MYHARKKIVAGRTNLRRATTSSRNCGDCATASQSTGGCVTGMTPPLSGAIV